jgi:hypothetical protein
MWGNRQWQEINVSQDDIERGKVDEWAVTGVSWPLRTGVERSQHEASPSSRMHTDSGLRTLVSSEIRDAEKGCNWGDSKDSSLTSSHRNESCCQPELRDWTGGYQVQGVTTRSLLTQAGEWQRHLHPPLPTQLLVLVPGLYLPPSPARFTVSSIKNN